MHVGPTRTCRNLSSLNLEVENPCLRIENPTVTRAVAQLEGIGLSCERPRLPSQFYKKEKSQKFITGTKEKAPWVGMSVLNDRSLDSISGAFPGGIPKP